MVNYKIIELFINVTIIYVKTKGGDTMKKLLSTLLIVPILGLFILTGNAFSKACEGDNNKPGYLKVSQLNQPAPSQEKQTPPSNTAPNMQKSKPGQNSSMPGQLNKQKPNNMKKNKNGQAMPGQKKPKM
jgi:hypothetical protein